MDTNDTNQPETQSEPSRARCAVPICSASDFPFTTVALPDGIVIGGPWPHTIIAWPGGKSRGATKPEYDLFQALEKAYAEIEFLSLMVGNLTHARDAFERLHAEACEDAARQASRVRDVALRMPPPNNAGHTPKEPSGSGGCV